MAYLYATGSHLPPQVVRNEDLTQFPAEFHARIEEKTGIRERRRAAEGVTTSDLGIEAARSCLEAAGVGAAELDAIVLTTSSPDRIQPATATRVQHELGATRAFACDLNSVCSGAVFALHFADGLVEAHGYENVLVVAAELYSRCTNPRDFSTYPYFGDGAGAMLLTRRPGRARVRAAILKTDGAGADVIQIPGGGAMLPYKQVGKDKDLYFRMKGREVFEFAVTEGSRIVAEVMEKAGLSRADVGHVVLHQANVHIVREIARRLEMDEDRFADIVATMGNTAAASPVVALDDRMRGERAPKPGDHLVMAAFGGGLSWGAIAFSFEKE